MFLILIKYNILNFFKYLSTELILGFHYGTPIFSSEIQFTEVLVL
jgi:hypothetical protein